MHLLSALPASTALVDDDPEFSDYLSANLRQQGVSATHFADSESLLCGPQPFDYAFYVLDLGLPGVDGLSLLRMLRRRSNAGVLVVSGMMEPELFERSLLAGADMYLAKPVSVEQVLLAMQTVHRRVQPAAEAGAAAPLPLWQLLPVARQLRAPDGQLIDLSDTDLTVLALLADAPEHVVTRAELAQALSLPEHDPANLVTATVYRLRRRIERGFPGVAPLQSRARVGYVFKARLERG